MAMIRTEQLPPIRVARSLRVALDDLAAAEGRTTSDYVRRRLIDDTVARVVAADSVRVA